MLDGHEKCYEEMRRIDAEWRERYNDSYRVKKVIITERDQNGTWERVGNIKHIIYESDGLTIFIA